MTSNMQRGRRIGRLLFGVSVLAAIASTLTVSASVRYVDLNNGSPAPPFTNWTAAATNIQDAIDAADAGDEIVVTNGVYQTGGGVAGAATNRVAVIKSIVVRSVNGPQSTTISGSGTLRCVYLANGASVSGFTLTSGVAGNGGGVACESASAVVSNCVLTGNSAATYGGGASGGTLNNCTLTGNSAQHGGGAATSTLNNCEVTGNSTGKSNAAFYESGGGAYSGTLNNCVVTGNSVGENCYGGEASSATLNNCTLAGNTALWGGGGGASSSTLNNCIVYFNRAPGDQGPNVNGCTLNSCFTTEPLFVDYAGGNLRLQTGSPCINVGNNAYAVGTTDLDGNPRIAGGTVDIGSYEYQGLSVNITATAGGSTVRNPDLPAYWVGSIVTVTATPATGYGFIRWTGDASGSTNPLTVVVNSDKNITAVFASTSLTLANQGVGTIAKFPDEPFYAVGEQVALSATAGRWHVFAGYTDGNANNPRTVTIGGEQRVHGSFHAHDAA